jgi:hypothetical protein
MRTDVYTVAQIANPLERAAQGSANAEHVVSPLLAPIAGYGRQRPSCFVCGKARSSGGVAIVQALNVVATHAMGGIVCAGYIALEPERLRANILEMLRTVGVKPGAGPGGRNVQLDGGRA